MKKIYLFVVAMIFLFSGCVNAPQENSNVSTNMSEFLETSDEISANVSEDNHEESKEPVYCAYADLGVPLAGRYGKDNATSLLSWDIIIYKDRLYVGSGSLSYNSGPVDIWSYGLNDNEWKLSATVPEEEVSRFYIIDGKLAIPGPDSRESWELGSIYFFDGETLEKKRTIPSAAHVFDIVSFNGKLFAPIEFVDDKIYHVAVSDDNGESFEIASLEKDGKYVFTQDGMWLKDVFVSGERVCAALVIGSKIEIYIYDGEDFIFFTEWTGLKSKGYGQYLFNGRCEYNGEFYFSRGYLYKCDENLNYELIKTPDGVVQDIYTYNGEMYLYTISHNGTDYVMTVYAYNGEFNEILSFAYSVPALSFATNGEKFYFSMFSQDEETKDNGRILEIEKDS